MNKTNILIIERDIALSKKLKEELGNYNLEITDSAENAISLNLNYFDIFVVEVNPTHQRPLFFSNIVNQLKNSENKSVIYLSDSCEERLKLQAFNSGADHFMIKPISIKDLLTRIKAVSRKLISHKIGSRILELDKLKLITSSKTILIDNKDINLTKTEFEILQLLWENSHKIFSREEILNFVWKNNDNVSVRTVDVNIRRIRQKIGLYSNFIKTKSGYGYFFKPNSLDAVEKTYHNEL